MTAPVWVLTETVLALHEQLLAEFGGSPGLRDEGLLASAMARPGNLYTYAAPHSSISPPATRSAW